MSETTSSRGHERPTFADVFEGLPDDQLRRIAAALDGARARPEPCMCQHTGPCRGPQWIEGSCPCFTVTRP